jgi:hypothetical protein
MKMIPKRAAALLLMAFAACHPRAPSTPKDEGRGATLAGVVMATGDYCGGAAPPQSILDELATPKPSPGFTLLLREGETNREDAPVVAEVLTDDEGRFSLSLPPGAYCVVDEDKRKKNPPPPGAGIGGPRCYDDWFEICLAVARVGEAPLEITVPYHRVCAGNPCVMPIPYP